MRPVCVCVAPTALHAVSALAAYPARRCFCNAFPLLRGFERLAALCVRMQIENWISGALHQFLRRRLSVCLDSEPDA